MSASTVTKRCPCPEARWPKCAHPWYLAKFRWRGVAHAPNLTRYAAEVLQPAREIPTKTEAETVADLVRAAIRTGAYVSVKTQRATAPKALAVGPTLGHLIAAFDRDVVTRDVHKRDTTKAGDRGNLTRFADFVPSVGGVALGTRPIGEVTIQDVIAFRASPAMATLANSTWAKYRTNLGQLFAWAVGEGHLAADPFASARPDQKKQLRRGKAARRSRRVDEREEAALLRAAGRGRVEHAADRLRGLIVAAIETGMRQGELLALQWGDVDLEQRLIYVRAVEIGAAKTAEPRPIPISQRLLDDLTEQALDPAGERFGRTAYVFGDAVGGRVTAVDKAWQTAVLRAHGHEPVWVKTALSPTSRARLDAIDLHFHDLRHEAGSRWLESKAFDPEQIRAMYGHTTVAQTAAYLHGRSQATRSAMQQYDAVVRHRAQQADAAAQNGPEDVSSVHKLSTKRGSGGRLGHGPRLIKGNKASVSK